MRKTIVWSDFCKNWIFSVFVVFENLHVYTKVLIF